MERKQGGCCLAPRYGGATTGQEAWQMGNIMLKFRPIAPKPAAMAPAPMTPPVTTAAALGAAGKGKRKRKAAAAGRGRRGRKPKKATTTTTLAVVTAAAPVTQKVDLRKDKPPLSSPSSSSSGTTSVDSSTPPPPPPQLAKEGVSAMPPRTDLAPAHVLLRPVASCVTIESVTATWREGEAPSAAASCGGVDEAPAFVSDQWGRVTWMNMAFSRAASAGDTATAPPPASDAGVVLAAKDGAAVPAWGTCAGFTCRVRVTYDAAFPRRGSLVAPCDVWRLDAGCYLWRLDLQATLTLSLGGLL